MFTQSTVINQQIRSTLFGFKQTSNFMPTILIVEDDEDNRMMLRILLEDWNYRVIEAADGIEALNIAKEECPDLIIMDVRLPLLDGMEVTRQIRQIKAICSIPVVFVSGCAEARYRAQASEVGANAYLVKPFDFDNLQLVIAEQLKTTSTY